MVHALDRRRDKICRSAHRWRQVPQGRGLDARQSHETKIGRFHSPGCQIDAGRPALAERRTQGRRETRQARDGREISEIFLGQIAESLRDSAMQGVTVNAALKAAGQPRRKTFDGGDPAPCPALPCQGDAPGIACRGTRDDNDSTGDSDVGGASMRRRQAAYPPHGSGLYLAPSRTPDDRRAFTSIVFFMHVVSAMIDQDADRAHASVSRVASRTHGHACPHRPPHHPCKIGTLDRGSASPWNA